MDYFYSKKKRTIAPAGIGFVCLAPPESRFPAPSPPRQCLSSPRSPQTRNSIITRVSAPKLPSSRASPTPSMPSAIIETKSSRGSAVMHSFTLPPLMKTSLSPIFSGADSGVENRPTLIPCQKSDMSNGKTQEKRNEEEKNGNDKGADKSLENGKYDVVNSGSQGEVKSKDKEQVKVKEKKNKKKKKKKKASQRDRQKKQEEEKAKEKDKERELEITKTITNEKLKEIEKGESEKAGAKGKVYEREKDLHKGIGKEKSAEENVKPKSNRPAKEQSKDSNKERSKKKDDDSESENDHVKAKQRLGEKEKVEKAAHGAVKSGQRNESEEKEKREQSNSNEKQEGGVKDNPQKRKKPTETEPEKKKLQKPKKQHARFGPRTKGRLSDEDGEVPFDFHEYEVVEEEPPQKQPEKSNSWALTEKVKDLEIPTGMLRKSQNSVEKPPSKSPSVPSSFSSIPTSVTTGTFVSMALSDTCFLLLSSDCELPYSRQRK